MTFVECNPLVFAAQGALLGTEKVAVKEREKTRNAWAGFDALAGGSGREGSPGPAASSVLSFHRLQPVSLYMATGGDRRVLCSVLS